MSKFLWLIPVLIIAAAAALINVSFGPNSTADAGDRDRCVRPDDNGDSRGRGRNDERQPKEKRCVVEFGLPGEAWDPGGPQGGGVTRDRVEPNLLQIKSGTTVDFNVLAGHRVLVYDHGLGGVTNFADVNATNVVTPAPPGPPVIAAEAGKTLLGPTASGQSVSLKFEEPGQYLIICAVQPHFLNFGMAMFVVVDESIN
jgi:plastocyanin